MIIGHESIVKYLTKALSSKHLAHAYLFYGPKNVGKTTVAWWFAKGLICQGNQPPCGQCSNCAAFAKSLYPDFYVIEPLPEGRDITIEQIRHLKSKVSQTAFYNSRKVVILRPAEYLNSESVNAFLKMLEEPPADTILILICNNIESLPATILSRSTMLKFSLLPQHQIEQALSDDYTREQKKFITNLAQGRIGQALCFNSEKIHGIIEAEKKVIKMLKSAPDQKISWLTENLASFDDNFVDLTTSLIRDILLHKINQSDFCIHTYLTVKNDFHYP